MTLLRNPRHALLCVLIASLAALAACAPAPASTTAAPQTAAVASSPATAARAAMAKIAPNATPERIANAPIEGFQQMVVDGRVVYASNDGKYLIQGSILDVDQRRDLTEAALAGVREEQLAQIPSADRIVFAPSNSKYTVTVFTDVECGYCRKFHEQIAAYNALGIAVEYVAFPRSGIGTPDYDKMVAVWCSSDRKAALTAAKSGTPIATATCPDSPVAREYEAGRKSGLMGTPMIVAKDGTQLGGYLPPDELKAALDRHAAEVLARS